jgi:GTP-binding protein
MLPVIAIVGRPNVGKSTLFNRLTKSRDALVADMPGVTRDRQYGQGRLGAKPYIVIDTGGIGEGEEGIDSPMTAQSKLAMQEADVVLFVVDGRAGITAADQQITQFLRQLHKPLFLVVNKTDGVDEHVAISEFYSLGLGEPFAIAAAHGRGVTQLIDHVSADFPEPSENEESEETEKNKGIKVAIIGKPNVGKSTLVNRMLGEERVIVYDQAGTTRDSIEIPLERHGVKYTIIDTAGIRRRGRVTEVVEKFSVVKALQAIESANVVLYIIDARENVSDQDLSLLGFIVDAGRSLVIAINKWDGLNQDQRAEVKEEVDRRLAFVSFAKLHTISALHGTGVGDLFRFIDEAYAAAMQDLSTSRLTKLLELAVKENPPPLAGGRRIKLRYANPGGHNPPIIVIHGNQAESAPNSYKRYLVNFYRHALRMVGTPLRIQFKTSDNPFKDRHNKLTPRQEYKRKRARKIFKKK